MALTYGGFALDNVPGGYFAQSRPMGTVQIQQNTVNIARMEGAKLAGSWVGEKKLQVLCKVAGTSRIDLEGKLDALYAALDKPNQPLAYHQSDTRYFIAKALYTPVQLGIGEIVRAIVPIDFICPNPYAFAGSPSSFDSGDITLTSSGSQWVTPVQNVTGGGNVFCRPTITITNHKTTMATRFLSTGLTSGSPYTTLTFTAGISVTLHDGDVLQLANFATPINLSNLHTQSVTVQGTNASGNTTINVYSFTANYSYPAYSGGFNPSGTTVSSLAGLTLLQIQQQADNQYFSVSGTNLIGGNGDYLTIICDPTITNGWNVIDSVTGLNLEFQGRPPTLNYGVTPYLITVNSNVASPVLVAHFDWTARWLS